MSSERGAGPALAAVVQDCDMNAKSWATTIIGVGLTLLGLLWFLQGANLVHLRPVMCLANCEPLVGGSAGWLIAGAAGMLAGILLIRWRMTRGRTA